MIRTLAAAWCVFGLSALALAQTHVTINEPPRRGDIVSDGPAEAAHRVQAAEPDVVARIARIKAELLELAAKPEFKKGDWAKDWAGHYVSGNSSPLKVDLYIAPNAGVACTCRGPIRDELRGVDEAEIVQTHDDGVTVRPKFGKGANGFLDQRLYFISWGDRRFLVPQWQMAEFANEYNTSPGNRRQMLLILHKESDSEERGPHALRFDTPPGKPLVPAEYEPWLHETPLWLRAVKVSPLKTEGHTPGKRDGIQTAEVTFDAGTDKGIYPGMKIIYPLQSTFADPVGALQQGKVTTIVITSVEAGSSKAIYTGSLQAKARPPAPHTGERIKTGMDEADERAMAGRFHFGSLRMK